MKWATQWILCNHRHTCTITTKTIGEFLCHKRDQNRIADLTIIVVTSVGYSVGGSLFGISSWIKLLDPTLRNFEPLIHHSELKHSNSAIDLKGHYLETGRNDACRVQQAKCNLLSGVANLFRINFVLPNGVHCLCLDLLPRFVAHCSELPPQLISGIFS